MTLPYPKRIVQCGYLAVLTNGEGQPADDDASIQLVQLPDIACRELVIALAKSSLLNTAFSPDGRSNANNSRPLFFGDAESQRFYLEEGDSEVLTVSNANQIWLSDVGFDWEGFNGDGQLLDYVLTACWRVTK